MVLTITSTTYHDLKTNLPKSSQLFKSQSSDYYCWSPDTKLQLGNSVEILAAGKTLTSETIKCLLILPVGEIVHHFTFSYTRSIEKVKWWVKLVSNFWRIYQFLSHPSSKKSDFVTVSVCRICSGLQPKRIYRY